MNIGLIIYGSQDTLSGGYLYDRMLVRELRRAEHRVEIISLPWRNYPAHLTDNTRRGWARAIARRGFDLLLQDELNHPSLVMHARGWRRDLGCPQIAIVHHLRSSEYHPAWRMPLYRTVERAYLRRVDGYIFNSQTTARTVADLTACVKPAHIAYPAADHIAPPTIDADNPARANAGEPLRVLFVGNVIPRKGLHYLIDGLARLDPAVWTLDIVGDATLDPDHAAHVRRAITQYGLTARITWHGRLDDAALRQRFAASDLLAVPSYEGFGIVYLEAMAFGLPVLAANTGAAWEIVDHGVNGFLVNPPDAVSIADAIRFLVEDRAARFAMSAAARARFDRHPTWAQSMAPCIKWLHEVSRT